MTKTSQKISHSKTRHWTIWKAAIAMGIPEHHLPRYLRNTVVDRSRRGKLGQIQVRRFGGIRPNSAAKTALQFERNVDRAELVNMLEASGPLGPSMKSLVDKLREPSRKKASLARLVAEAGVDLFAVIRSYRDGAVAVNSAIAVAQAARGMPAVVRETLRHALPHEGICKLCFGSGKVPRRASEVKAGTPCPTCEGKGLSLENSEHYQFATKLLAEMSGALPKSPGVQVNQQVAVLNAGNLAEKLAHFGDRLIRRDDIVDVPSSSSPAETHQSD